MIARILAFLIGASLVVPVASPASAGSNCQPVWLGDVGHGTHAIMQAEDGTLVEISRTGGGEDSADIYGLDVSPVGDAVAFSSQPLFGGVGTAYVADLGGTNRLHLSDLAFVPDGYDTLLAGWSPSGDSVSFSSFVTTADVGEAYLVDPAGGLLVEYDDGSSAVNAYPAFSPGGDKVAWLTGAQTGTGIAYSELDGSSPTDLLDPPAAVDPLTIQSLLQWTPDSSHIVFLGSVGATLSLYSVKVATAELIEIAVVPPANAFPWYRVSPTENKVAWGTPNGDLANINVANVDGTSVVDLVAVIAGGAINTASTPEWDPDGSRLVLWGGLADLAGVVSPENSGIYSVKPDGSELTLLVSGTTTDGPTLPILSPDGARLAWFGATGLAVADADGSNRLDLGPGGPSFLDAILGQASIDWACGETQAGYQPGACLSFGATEPHGFNDIPPGSSYEDAVAWLEVNNITLGIKADEYGPQDLVTRAQMAAFLHRMACLQEAPAQVFSDVVAGAYYEQAVFWLAWMEITTGTAPGVYSPSNDVTRAQIAAFLYRLAGEPIGAPPHSFSDIVAGAYYDDAVSWLLFRGITQGVTATTYEPDAPVTRAQMALFLYRLNTNDVTPLTVPVLAGEAVPASALDGSAARFPLFSR